MGAAALGVVGIAMGAAGLALTGRLDAVRVRGRSMAPTLRAGDLLLVSRLRRAPRVGDIVVATDPRQPGRELVKRVAAVDPDGVALLGDDPQHSADARSFGVLPLDAVRWRVLVRYWPPRRIGRPRSLPART